MCFPTLFFHKWNVETFMGLHTYTVSVCPRLGFGNSSPSPSQLALRFKNHTNWSLFFSLRDDTADLQPWLLCLTHGDSYKIILFIFEILSFLCCQHWLVSREISLWMWYFLVKIVGFPKRPSLCDYQRAVSDLDIVQHGLPCTYSIFNDSNCPRQHFRGVIYWASERCYPCTFATSTSTVVKI